MKKEKRWSGVGLGKLGRQGGLGKDELGWVCTEPTKLGWAGHEVWGEAEGQTKRGWGKCRGKFESFSGDGKGNDKGTVLEIHEDS